MYWAVSASLHDKHWSRRIGVSLFQKRLMAPNGMVDSFWTGIIALWEHLPLHGSNLHFIGATYTLWGKVTLHENSCNSVGKIFPAPYFDPHYLCSSSKLQKKLKWRKHLMYYFTASLLLYKVMRCIEIKLLITNSAFSALVLSLLTGSTEDLNGVSIGFRFNRCLQH